MLAVGLRVKPHGGASETSLSVWPRPVLLQKQVPAACIWRDGIWADHPQVSAAVRERPRPTEPPFSLLKGLTSRELVKRGSVLQFTVQGYLSPHAHAFLPLVKP